MAILDLVNNVTKAINNNMYTVGIFMDLSKAFDTIDHNILLSKLYNYGFRGVSYEWFKNYLTNRKQYVSYNHVNSSYENVNCGVPQGSILGPLLFVIYMNDICNSSKLLSFILFADDTTVFYSDHSIDNMVNVLNNELSEICNWFKCNKLSLNTDKTNLMFLGTRHQTKNINSTHILLDGCELTRVQEASFLGVTLDQNLTWKQHINKISKKCSRNIGVLNKMKHFLPEKSLQLLYHSLISSHINYGILLWGKANKGYMNKILKIQKKAIRIITNSPYLCHTEPLFEKLNLLNVFDIYKKELGIFMFKL